MLAAEFHPCLPAAPTILRGNLCVRLDLASRVKNCTCKETLDMKLIIVSCLWIW